MKIAVGIIALVFSLAALLQACAVTGLSGAAGEVSTQQAGSIGMLVALAIFFGGGIFLCPTKGGTTHISSRISSVSARQEGFP